MDKTIDFYFGVGSRYCYLASALLQGIESRTGYQFIWKPIYSPDLIKKTSGTRYSKDCIGAHNTGYRRNDVARWARLYGLPFVEPDASMDYHSLCHACLQAMTLGLANKFTVTLWSQLFSGSDIKDANIVIRKTCALLSLAEKDFMNGINSAETIALGERLIDEAMERKAFGVPTFIVNKSGELFWGQDRLPLLEHYIQSLDG